MRSWVRSNFYPYKRPFKHCLCFIRKAKFYACTHIKILLRDTGNQLLGPDICKCKLFVRAITFFSSIYNKQLETSLMILDSPIDVQDSKERVLFDISGKRIVDTVNYPLKKLRINVLADCFSSTIGLKRKNMGITSNRVTRESYNPSFY